MNMPSGHPFPTGVTTQGVDAGRGDWRVANIKELTSIVDWTCYEATVNLVVFPGTDSLVFWSSTPYSCVDVSAWVFYFFTVGAGAYGKILTGRVRLVRGGL